MKYLITNADDYGYRSDISQAIVDSHKNGYLTSTTVLINFVSSEDIQLAKSSSSLGFGLHLNLTSGEPLTENWKRKYGSFSRPFRNESKQFNREVWLPFFEKYSTEDVHEEYEAQLKKFEELFGFPPTHIDSHHYSSSYQSTFPAYIELAKKYNLPVRRPKIWDLAKNQHLMGNITQIPELESILATEKIKTTNFFSVKYLNRYEDYLVELEKELDQVKDGESIEVSFHPGYEEEWRKKDLMIIKDSRVKQLLDKKDFKIIKFSDLED
ncbi:MAG TPA: ChbG/HpnK family deacetylase [Candidatus Levybacteria bacterium]|nr:ChbG/HpnK family deacetylase [Candidatus Levybacteria bacterium]